MEIADSSVCVVVEILHVESSAVSCCQNALVLFRLLEVQGRVYIGLL